MRAAYLELHRDADVHGELRPAFIEFGKAVEQAARMLDRLGCSPRSRAALGDDLGLLAEDQQNSVTALSDGGATPKLAIAAATVRFDADTTTSVTPL